MPTGIYLRTKPTWNKGLTGKLSHSFGRKHSEEHKKKIYTPERNKKISESMKGKNNPRYGKKPTIKQLENLKLGQGWNKNKKMPEISGKNHPSYGKFGKNHPCWKENKKRPFYKLIRELYQYRNW